mmetsp:Transcript_23255/g.77198  ORF Transcript_23255/g.77198 Transcript_23255/m.77198 type:complete len:242 (-) Transcript_23255:2002-2727(-)
MPNTFRHPQPPTRDIRARNSTAPPERAALCPYPRPARIPSIHTPYALRGDLAPSMPKLSREELLPYRDRLRAARAECMRQGSLLCGDAFTEVVLEGALPPRARDHSVLVSLQPVDGFGRLDHRGLHRVLAKVSHAPRRCVHHACVELERPRLDAAAYASRPQQHLDRVEGGELRRELPHLQVKTSRGQVRLGILALHDGAQARHHQLVEDDLDGRTRLVLPAQLLEGRLDDGRVGLHEDEQ